MKSDFHVGDEVRVFDGSGSRIGRPVGGWVGTVTSVARKYATVTYGGRTGKFDMATGRDAERYSYRRVKTLTQVAEDERATVARQTLTDFGLYERISGTLPTAALEAVAAALIGELATEPRQVRAPPPMPRRLRRVFVPVLLTAGVPVTQVAEWAGLTAEVLLRGYPVAEATQVPPLATAELIAWMHAASGSEIEP